MNHDGIRGPRFPRSIAEDARSRSAQKFCRNALAIVARLFRLWYRFRGQMHDRRGNPQPLDRRRLIIQSIPLQKKLFALAQAHPEDSDREVRNLTTALFVHCHRLFTFWKKKAWNQATMLSSAAYASPYSGAGSALAIAATTGKSP